MRISGCTEERPPRRGDAVELGHREVHQDDVRALGAGRLSSASGTVGRGPRRARRRRAVSSTCSRPARTTRVIVGHDHADHRAPTSRGHRRAAARLGRSTARRPPRSRARSRSRSSPRCPSARRALGPARAWEPRAVVLDDQGGRARPRAGHPHLRPGEAPAWGAWTLRMRLLRRAEQRAARGPLAPGPFPGTTGDAGWNTPRAGQRAPRDPRAPAPGRSVLEVRRVDLDEQRSAGAACSRACRRRGGAKRGGLASPCARSGTRRQAERDPGQVLHHPVVQVGGDTPALGVGRLDRPLQQQLALAPVAGRAGARATALRETPAAATAPASAASSAGANERQSRGPSATTEL